MSYKNDHLLTIVNKYGKAGSDAKAELFETWDQLRDLSVSGPAIGGTGYGPTAGFLLNLARLFAPASFMPVLGNSYMNIPGTSYSSPISGGNGIVAGGQAAFGLGSMSNYPGFPTGGAAPLALSLGMMGLPLLTGIGSGYTSLTDNSAIGGISTGGAASLVNAGSALSAAAGTATGFNSNGASIVLPAAGLIAGVGGILSSISPFFGPFGLAGGIAGNLANGYAGAILNSYQRVSSGIVNNANVILSEKIKNIETVVKQLDTQSDVLRKMLKESVEGDSKVLQNL